MAKGMEPNRDEAERNEKLDKYFYLRNSRAEQRRYIAKEVLIEILRMSPRGKLYDYYKDADDVAKQAEDLAHALVRRLAAREEHEIEHGVYAATERI
jgi:hypothetical protein